MNSARLGRGLLVGLAVLLLVGSNAAFASSGQSLNMTVPIGGVTNLGTQTYTVSGGYSYGGMVDGIQVNPSTISYSLAATQNGMNTMGSGSIKMSGTTVTGQRFRVSGTFTINSAVPGGIVGSSELPLYFVATAPNVKITLAGTSVVLSQPLLIESPYFNPWGGPITIASYDGSTLAIAATYTVGQIYWQGSQVGGPLVGTLAGQPVSGIFSTTTNENENLVTGRASDSGTVSFSGMSPSSLDEQGRLTGTSMIPTAGASDCSTILMTLPGTCTFTGFQSQGTFRAGPIYGSYQTEWLAPAIEFSSTITATVSQGHQGGHNGFFGFLSFL